MTRRTRLRKLRVPAALCLALFLVSFNLFTLTTLIAPIVRGLGTTVGNVQTVLVLLSLVTAAVVPASHSLGGMYGQRRLLTAGLYLFILAALASAASPTILALLLGFSILGGLAAAPLITLPWALMQGSYTGRRRDLGLMALTTSVALGGALAPPLAGFIADAADWRWAFLPQAAAATAVLLLIRPLPDAPSQPNKPVDWLGGALALIGLGAVLAGLSLADEYGWWAPRKLFLMFGIWRQPFALSVAPVLMMAGTALLGLWIFERSSRVGRSRVRLFRFGLFRDSRFMAGVLTGAFHGFAIAGLMFALFTYIPFAFELKSLATAIAVLPFNLANLAVNALAPSLSRRIVPKRILQSGLAVGGAGALLLFGAMSPGTSIVDLLPGLIVMGVGAGLAFDQTARLTLSLPGPDLAGEASGIYNAFQNLGSSLGTAIVGAVLMMSAATYIVDGVTKDVGLSVPSGRRDHLVYQLSETVQTMKPEDRKQIVARFPPEVESALQSVVPRAVADAMRLALLTICGSQALALAASVFLPRGKLSSV